MKRIVSAVLSFSLLSAGLPSFSQIQEPQASEGAEIPTVAIKLPETPGHPAATLVVSQINPNQEPDMVERLASHKEPIFFTARSGDPVNRELNGHTNAIVSADQPEELPLFSGAKGRSALARIKAAIATHRQILVQNSPALLIALIPASGYGAYFWYLSSHFMQGAGAFTWEFLITSAIGIYTHQWLAFSKRVGGGVNAGAMLAASLIKKKWSERAQERWRRTGQVLTAYGLNLISAFALMGIGQQLGSWHNDLFAFMFALFASNEIIDYKSEQVLDNLRSTHVTQAVWTRQIIYSALELLSLSGTHWAEIFAGTTVGAAVLAFVFKEEVHSAGVRAGVSFWNRLKKVKKFVLRERKCERILERRRRAS